jgi:polar amino acid transport system substrate-binding protein
VVTDAASAEHKGVGYDLGRELSARLGLPFEPVIISRPAEFIEALKAGKVDVVFMNATPVRAKDVDFTPTVLDIEQGLLVRGNSPASVLAEADRAGMRVGVSAGGTSEAILSGYLKKATVVPIATIKSAIEQLLAGKLDAFASNKAVLLEMTNELRDSRILDGSYGVEHMALAIPKGRDQGMVYLRQFLEEARSGGLVQRSAARAGLRGAVLPGSQ